MQDNYQILSKSIREHMPLRFQITKKKYLISCISNRVLIHTHTHTEWSRKRNFLFEFSSILFCQSIVFLLAMYIFILVRSRFFFLVNGPSSLLDY